jgi:HAD superfamily hydrolase (TIGR01509 family)
MTIPRGEPAATGGTGALVRCLLFDLDGTLFFTEEANFAAYARAFAEVGFTLEREAYRRAFGLRFDSMVSAVGARLDAAQASQVREAKARHYRECLGQVTPNAPLIALLRALRPTHRTALVTTAARQNARALLEHFDLMSAFDVAIYGEDVVRPKPDPEGYLSAVRQLGVSPAECLAFEDSESGLAAARAADLHVVRIPTP